PTPVPPEVLEVLSRPAIHHRGPDFLKAYRSVLDRLKLVFRTEHDVLLMTSSGTGAFESAVANLTEPGGRALVVSHGNFGERWAAMVARYGADLDHLAYAWGDAPDPAEVGERAKGAAVVYVVHSETSTGVVSDLQPIAAAAKEQGALVVVDAISSLAAAFDRHVRLGRATRAGVKSMGLELASPDEDRAAVVTTVRAPEELDVAAFLLDLRDRLGVQLIGGQGQWKGKVFRIGHIGYFDLFDITTALAAVEDGLAAAGVEIERSVGVGAALAA